jgi:predicted RNA-binding Zn ribbon-like protein
MRNLRVTGYDDFVSHDHKAKAVTGQVDFNSHTDIVVRTAVELVNLLTEGEERGRAYLPPTGTERVAQLNALFAAAHSRTRVTEQEAEAFGGVAARLRGAFTAIAAGDIDTAAHQVNGMLKATGAHPSLERHDGETWHIHFHAADEQSRVNGWAAGCATGLAIVVGGEHYDRLGVCTAPHCDRVYVDTSRNGSKRFCSTACQNRVKAATFREARREAAATS